MIDAFVDVPLADIIDQIRAIASAAAGSPVEVRVGEEAYGYRNIGVDFPPGRRSAAEGRKLRTRMRAALEAAGIPSAPNTLSPKVGGDLLGNVRVREVAINMGDAAGLLRAPGRG
jgi:hypothetical protein